MDETIKALLESHLVDVSRLTHFRNDDDYWHVFNKDTMTGFEITGTAEDVYTIDCWITTEFYIDLALKDATEIQ